MEGSKINSLLSITYMCEEKEKFEFTHINERNNSEIKGGTNNGN